MKSALSLTLIVCLVASAPLTAQKQTDTPESFDLRGPATPVMAGPIVRAIMREAVRLDGAGPPTPTGIETVVRADKPVAESEQTAANPPLTPDRHLRGDATASVGFFNLNRKEGPYPRGFESATPAIVVSGGYYWNEHLKSEVEVGWIGTRHDIYDESDTSDTTVFLDHNYSIVRSSLAQIYQFGRNSRFHPYLGVGVAIDVEHGDDTVECLSLPGVCTSTSSTPTYTTTLAHVFAKAGFKRHLFKSAFFITELKIGNRVERDLKLGFGVDF